MIPFTLNPLPHTGTWVILTVELPVFVTVTVLLELVPTSTMPKASVVGLTVNSAAAQLENIAKARMETNTLKQSELGQRHVRWGRWLMFFLT